MMKESSRWAWKKELFLHCMKSFEVRKELAIQQIKKTHVFRGAENQRPDEVEEKESRAMTKSPVNHAEI